MTTYDHLISEYRFFTERNDLPHAGACTRDLPVSGLEKEHFQGIDLGTTTIDLRTGEIIEVKERK